MDDGGLGSAVGGGVVVVVGDKDRSVDDFICGDLWRFNTRDHLCKEISAHT